MGLGRKIRNMLIAITASSMMLTAVPMPEAVAESETKLPQACYNLYDDLKSKSFLTTTDDGYMRVFYNNEDIVIEYYNDDFQVISVKTIKPELDIWGGFYEGSDAYYLIQGTANEAEDDSAEVIRVIQYDKDWNRISAASITTNSSLWGAEVRYPFDAGSVETVEYNGYLYIVTGHEGYVDPEYNQGHQGFLMIRVNTDTMQGEIIDADLWHSFSQYIVNDNADLYVLEQSEGSRYTKLSKYTADDSGSVSLDGSMPVLEYGGDRTSAWAIACYASADAIGLSSENILCLGNSIDQSYYDEYDYDTTSYNIYLTVTPKSDFSEEATEVKWLTDYAGDGTAFVGEMLTKINDDRFMISWREYNSTEDTSVTDIGDSLSAYTLHYIFIDGDGNKLSDEFTARAGYSECQPVVKDGKAVFYASDLNIVNFYSIDTETGELSKKNYRIAGDNVQWNIENGVLTLFGTGDTHDANEFSYTWGGIKENVKKIVVESGVTSISDNMFEGFPNLQEVYIEEGLKSIGSMAFLRCEKLEKIFIPSTVDKIGEDFLWTGYFWLYDGAHVVDAKIYAASDSYAAEYAKTNGIDFVSTDGFPSEDVIADNGDANQDGAVNVRDAAYIAYMLATGCGDFLSTSADFNEDGKINVRDAASIASALAKGTIKQ